MKLVGRVRSVRFFSLLLLVSCKTKPVAPFDGLCLVSELEAKPARPVQLVMMFSPTVAGPVRPTGAVRLEVWEVGPSSKQRCQLQTAVTAASFRADGESVLSLPAAEPCVGAAPASGHVEVRAFFTADASAKQFECQSDRALPVAWNSPVRDPRPVVRVDIKDALRLPNGKVDEASKPIRIYARVPESFLAAGALTSQAKAALLAKMYGGSEWETGNRDGSRFLVRSFESKPLSPAEIAASVWTSEPPQTSLWFYDTMPDGSLDKRGSNFGPVPPIKVEHLDQR